MLCIDPVFASTVVGKSSDTNSVNSREDKGNGQAATVIKSVAGNNPKGKAPALPSGKRSNQKPVAVSDRDSEDECRNEQCANCLGTIDTTSVKATCTVCYGHFHIACTGIPDEMRKH